MANEVHCPKCGSTQITANKKGFSGKKAVVGGILTGGIGLLAGTLGSGKVIITCLACGYQFRPGDRPSIASTHQIITNRPIKPSTPFANFIIILFLGIAITIVLLATCNDTSEKSDLNKEASTDLNKYYSIQYEDIHRPTQRNIGVYIIDTSKIRSINLALINKYNSDKSNYMSATYFDDSATAKVYDIKISDSQTSDKQADKMYRHIVANYVYNPSNNYEKLEFFHHKKKSKN